MKNIIKLIAPLLVLFMLVGCDNDKEWIYVTEVQPGAYVSGSATSYSAIAPAAAFKAGDVDPDTDDRTGVSTMYTWLKADGELFITVSEGSDKVTTYGKGTEISDVTSQLVADAPAYKVAADGLYFLIYNSKLKQLSVIPAKFGVIGSATPGGWDGETVMEDVSYNEATSIVTMKGDFVFAKGEMKFRFNNDWGLEVPYDESSVIKYHTNMGGLVAGDFGESSLTLKGGGENLNIPAGAQYSVTLELNLRTGLFSAKGKAGDIIEPEYPEELYMIGSEFGNWTWTDAGIVQLTPVHSKIGTFWTIKYFTKDQPFKWAPQKAWSGDFSGLGENTGFTISDGNAIVAEDGLYMVYIDIPADKIVIERPTVYGIGDAFGSWDAPTAFAIDGKKMTATTTNTEAKNLRMYATSTLAAGVDWWKMEFNIFDGTIVYRGGGGDQDAVSVQPGAKITLDFSTDTGTIE